MLKEHKMEHISSGHEGESLLVIQWQSIICETPRRVPKQENLVRDECMELLCTMKEGLLGKKTVRNQR
jgi:hypothetical protein